MNDIDIFLYSLRTAKPATKKLHTYSLKAWKEYCSREHLLTHNAEEKDIDGFIAWGMSEKGWKIGTVKNYLDPLALFYKKHNKALRRYILRQQKDFTILKKNMETKKPDEEQPLVFDIALKLLE